MGWGFFSYVFMLFSFFDVNCGVLSAELFSEDGDTAWDSPGFR